MVIESRAHVIEAVAGYLFAERTASVYGIIDGASVAKLLDNLYRYEPDFECLYRGDLDPDLAEVAPYLVCLERKSAFTEWIINEGWGNHWGIFATAKTDLHSMRQHLRRFLTVHDPSGNPMLFRYYDPRVLRVYLPTCNAEELSAIFGPILQYVSEGENAGQLLRFELIGGQLKQQLKQMIKEE